MFGWMDDVKPVHLSDLALNRAPCDPSLLLLSVKADAILGGFSPRVNGSVR